ncbi:hypothetical protein HRR83_008704 [Exophiala dermatitidis]|uniref:Uncharacterized protein n=2 Tax=Exophiala dermatitidis TaxID=5970 RepID=H6BX86_EXODN|nr:uncharacterized protein HMPREF1120_04281 [Exophiala dermatitidis NIH/UT8656]KAJ4505246.1 hypothetical protein HRR73_008519 [Exophiala dermatitidis]EHY56188.1 hypothetical protein HMPREF1120_04281 [Exophiala dermatitidis NIH/UT8656]KAJ4505705.1 hypothetical protein HRR74_008616 [Exophiala dermatitidis]KAJ4536368.1 hypothetical protein HRR77_007289 [Exophiala dermatitidis]KAJ4541103.1 hypothetical protein HRR76_004480 [Exophiala dermatitidis]
MRPSTSANFQLLAIAFFLCTVFKAVVVAGLPLPHPVLVSLEDFIPQQPEGREDNNNINRGGKDVQVVDPKGRPKPVSFTPQPQYIVLTPPLLQHDVQRQMPVEVLTHVSSAPAAGRNRYRFFSRGRRRDARDRNEPSGLLAGSGNVGVDVQEDTSGGDWEAWGQQFQAQLRERRCHTQGADCSASAKVKR